MDDVRSPIDADTLQGWKDIAVHLGKSVRSAQRWEARLGLPVRRITTPDGGQIVHASRIEIDAWRRRQVDPPGDADDSEPDDASETGTGGGDNADGGGTVLPDPPPISGAALPLEAPVPDPPPQHAPGPTPPTGRRPVALAAMLALGLVLGAALAFALIPVVVTPSQFEVDGREVRALHASGRLAWTHRLDQAGVTPANMEQSQPKQGDIDGDGAFDVAIGVSYTTPNWLPEAVSDEVLLFSRTGRMRWRVRPPDSLQFVLDGRTVRGPWLLHDAAFAVIPGPRSEPTSPDARPSIAPSAPAPGRLWLAYSDPGMRLGFVIEVSPDGRQMLRYVQDGPVKTLIHWRTASGNFLAAGGIDAASRRASTAIIDLAGAPARWPIEGRFSCAGCPTSPPHAVTLMPRSEVGLARLRASPVIFRLVAENGALRMDDDDGARSGALAWLGPDMKVTRYIHSSRYWEAHRQLENEGRVKHSTLACPHRITPARLSVWAHGSWKEQDLTPAPSS